MIYGFVCEKGGSGKTTVAFNFAVALTIRGRKVVIVDADTQGSMSKILRIREKHGHTPVLYGEQHCEGELAAKVNALAKIYDDVVIDTHGGDSISTRFAVLASDRLVVPVAPSSLDAWQLPLVHQWVESLRDEKPKLKALVFVNRGFTHSGDDMNAAVFKYAGKFDSLSVLSAIVSYRKEFARSVGSGLSVVEQHNREAERARDEIFALTKEILNYV